MRKHGHRGRKASARTVCGLSLEHSRATNEQRLKSNTRNARMRAPFYDRERRQLRVGEVVLKCFNQSSDAQEVILAVFQEESWSRTIDDPLPGKERQERKQRLRMAVANLNRRQRVPMLHFHVLRQGTAVAWEYRDESETSETPQRR